MVIRGVSRFFVLMLAGLFCGQALGAVTITDARGEHTFDRTPQRVVTLSWAMTEDVVELGVKPVGVADIDGYHTWVVRPSIPEGVADIGTRDEPSIEELAALKPDVIILANGQEDLIDRLEQVAPVLYFDAFSADHNNATVARRIFRNLGHLFGKEDVAEQKLAAMDTRFNTLKQQLHDHFGTDLPRVANIRFNNKAVVFVYGENAMSSYVLRELGLASALDIPPSQWGVTQKKMITLSTLEADDVLLYFKPAPGVEKLFESPLWQAMPVVKAGHVAGVESTWSYGGALSLRYLAEAMTDALLTIEP